MDEVRALTYLENHSAGEVFAAFAAAASEPANSTLISSSTSGLCLTRGAFRHCFAQLVRPGVSDARALAKAMPLVDNLFTGVYICSGYPMP